ncbi:MAG: polysaccharide biosynthesis/export family protein [Desulfatibacillaceae bacterium]
MRIRITILFTLLAVFTFGVCFPRLGPAQPSEYHIGSRDVIRLVVTAGGERQMEQELTVSQDGTVNVPMLGPVTAGGLSPERLADSIRKDLARDYFVNPHVSVTITGYHSLRYHISGAVGKPGMVEASARMTLMELIARAEGLRPEHGNLAYVIRKSMDSLDGDNTAMDLVEKKDAITVDLTALLDKGQMQHNVDLLTGDVVYIPMEKALSQSTSKIFVEGNVKNPGVYDYQPGITAFNACILAGGFDEFAAPGRARVSRKDPESPGGRTIIKVDLDAVRDGDKPDVELKPGDRVHVPQTWF